MSLGTKMLIMLIFIPFTLSNAQEKNNPLFKEVDILLESAKSLNAQLLSPNNYTKGLDYYKDAEEGLKNGESVNDISTDIEKAIEFLRKAVEISTLAEEALSDLIKSRNDAESAGAKIAVPDLWEDGVDNFLEATEEFESGYIKDAKEIAKESEKYFRDAELKAIKNKIIGPTLELLQQAEDQSVVDYAPVTLAKSKLLVQQAESELNDKRYDNSNAERLADEAYYEVKHAIRISKLIREMNEKDKTWEDVILSAEEPLKDIAQKYSLKARFDTGYEDTKNSIIEFVESIRDDKVNVEKQFNDLMNSNNELLNQIAAYKEEIVNIESSKKELQLKLDFIKQEKIEFDNIASQFSISEAEVLKDSYNIVIRLSSLNFDTGKSIIDPQYYSLLSKVQKAIQTFPDCTVSVEGHTDSQGSDDANLSLSQERADAVRQYLLANLDINSNKILAIGYGETKPIANNEAEEGRRKNRRIDVVINPNIID